MKTFLNWLLIALWFIADLAACNYERPSVQQTHDLAGGTLVHVDLQDNHETTCYLFVPDAGSPSLSCLR